MEQSQLFAHKLLHHFLKDSSKRVFISDDDQCLTGADLIELAGKKPLRVSRSRIVFCLLENTIDSLIGYLSLILNGAVPFMLSSSISRDKLIDLVDIYKPSLIWLPSCMSAAVFEQKKPLIAQGSYELLDLGYPLVPIHSSLALLLGTSGSTGSSKLVRLSHENIWSNAKSIAQYLKLDSKEIPVTTLPPSYTFGLSVIHSHMLVGATVAVTNKSFFEKEFWNFIRDVNVTSLSGVPYHFEILKRLRFFKMDFSDLRTLTQAGGKMDPQQTREFAEYCTSNGMRFFSMYGQAEATARISYLPWQKSASKAGSIGNAIPGGRLWLETDTGQIINDCDVEGELVYEGPNVSMGYAESLNDLSKADERNGVLHTGDLATYDKDGDFFIVGRLKRFLKLFGHRVNLVDIEKFLSKIGYDAVCAGKDDALEVYATDLSARQGIEIKKQIVNYLHIAPSGVMVIALKEIPRNESGKVQYGLLNAKMGDSIS